jgi:hypothetical protein
LVAGRVENDLALIGWNRAQILKGMLDQDAAIGGQGRELAAGGAEPLAILRRHVLDGLAPLKTTLALFGGHLVELV